MDYFLVDNKRATIRSYEDLIDDLNKKVSLRKYAYFENPYDIFTEIIGSMVFGKQIILLDSDFSSTEIENLGISNEEISDVQSIENGGFSNFESVIEQIEANRNKWSIVLYTSGTTGKPKKVTHSFNTIMRNLRVAEKYKNNIWAFAYNPTHFAGLQVFFQAFFNRNAMIYIFDLEKAKVGDVLEQYGVTNISATPTFYRTIIPHIKKHVMSVKKVTLGGEKFDNNLISYINEIFPAADIVNIYASTEAGSLFNSKGEMFSINDKVRNLISISDEGELLIHKSALGESEEYSFDGEWYHTGDIVELVSNNELRFVSRITEMINVGGYKVNPHEVEDEINKVAGVVDVLVYGRKNSVIGNVLVAEVKKANGTSEDDIKKEIQGSLSKKLQPWKIPRLIKFVDEINNTRTAKKVRK